MANSADPDQLASSEANWSGSALFAKAGHIRVQQDKGNEKKKKKKKTNATYETTGIQTKNCNRGTALKKSLEKLHGCLNQFYLICET